MSNKTEEALRREVRDAFFNPTLGLHRSVDILDHPNVRKAFDALRDHYQARPTFEGDEAKVRRWLTNWTMDANKVSGLEALALLDAKDAEIAEWRNAVAVERDEAITATIERDAALSRAEQAEAALAGARGNANKAVDNAAELSLEIVGLRSELAERDAAIVEAVDALQRGKPCEAHAKLLSFLPAKPVVDPLDSAEGFERAVLDMQERCWGDSTTTHIRLSALCDDRRAALSRAGGVKAVFGEAYDGAS